MENKSVRQQIVERVKSANNVLVTVSTNPSVDQLSACIGLTLMLNKLGKHATAVFSGAVPSTIEFLQPEKTLEKTTDSLRDFIIALDKSKADKLRYKVEDKLVKIFITPYRTSIDEKDLEFSQGDFNVDVVLALGVQKREDLDQAIVAHGRILHDATVISVTKTAGETLGSVNWQDPNTSSLSEMVASISEDLQPNLLDGQMATALLTGIVAETERFSNSKTTPQTMATSSRLMAAGANQQLIASKLDQPPPAPKDEDKPDKPEKPKSDDDAGALSIEHEDKKAEKDADEGQPSEQGTEDSTSVVDQIHIDEHGRLSTTKPDESEPSADDGKLDPPQHSGTLTANTKPEPLDPGIDSFTLPPLQPTPTLTHQTPGVNSPGSASLPKIDDDEKLSDIEQTVHSPHANPPASINLPTRDLMPPAQAFGTPTPPIEPPMTTRSPFAPAPNLTPPSTPVDPLSQTTYMAPPLAEPVQDQPNPQLNNARDAVQDAIQASSSTPLEPIEALGAQPIDLNAPAPEPSPQPAGLPASPPPPVPPPLPSQYLPPAITPTLPTADEFEQQQGASDEA